MIRISSDSNFLEGNCLLRHWSVILASDFWKPIKQAENINNNEYQLLLEQKLS